MDRLKRMFMFLWSKIPRSAEEPIIQKARDERAERLREQQRRALMLGVELDSLRRSTDE